MKKTSFLSLIAAALLFASCEEFMGVWDYATASMVIRITDDAGVNLLDTTQAGNLFEKGMGTLETPDSPELTSPIRTYDEFALEPETRAYVGPWAGAVLTVDSHGVPVLFIGEFNEINMTKNWRELTLTFADGRNTTIGYIHRADSRHKLHTEADVTRKSEGMNVVVDFSTAYDVSWIAIGRNLQ